MEVTQKIVRKEDIEAPDILYKYRRWDKHQHRTLLSVQTVYMAPPSSFEDKQEFKNFKRYELMTDQEIHELCLKHSWYLNPGFSETEHDAFANKWSKVVPLRDEITLKLHREQFYKLYNERVGVLSLTANNHSYKMWKKYSYNFTGFCVGLDRRILFDAFIPRGGGGIVQYVEELPLIKGTDSHSIERIKMTYFKESYWCFEEEYRTDIFDRNPLSKTDRLVRLSRECIKHVILGYKMPVREVNRILAVCDKAHLDIHRYRASLTEDLEVKIEAM